MRTDLPTISMGRIVLREISEMDYLDYYEIGRDYETTKYLNWGPFQNPNEALWIIREVFYKRPLNNIPVGYAIVYDGKMIGMIDYHTYHPNTNTAEIGYILHREYWNRGIMKRCLKKVVEIGFYHLNLNKILVGHTARNEASKRVILACGFKYEFEQLAQIKENEEIAYYYAMYSYEYQGGAR